MAGDTIAGVALVEVLRVLRWELGASRGARYARRVASQQGEYAPVYQEAARILELEAGAVEGGGSDNGQ